jgi:hypothetical protein
MQNVILVGATLIPIVLYCATYLFSNWPNYIAHVTSSLPRLLMQMVPTTLLAIATVLPLKSGQSEKFRLRPSVS